MKRLRPLNLWIPRPVDDLPSLSQGNESVIAGVGPFCHYPVLNHLKTVEKPEWAHLAFGTG
jgi:hypothetical protein